MLLELGGVSKNFGGFSLSPVSLAIQPGEFFCLLGPSGCGKTTLLRLIGGFETPSEGTIRLGGEDITSLAPHQRRIHTVFQRYALFPHLNVQENVAFPLKLLRPTPADWRDRVQRALQMMEIEALADRRIHQLSGGQSQRVALARALVNQPPVLLLDEPLSALDPSLRTRMREELRSLCKRVGSTFVMVTHDQEEALQVSDRLAVLRDGKCLQVGTPKEIYEEPCDPFVARFIGPVNEIPVSPSEEGGDTLVVQSELGPFRARRPQQALGANARLLLRPEKVRILRQKSTHENLLEGTIQDLSYLGSRTEYSVSIGRHSFRVFEPEMERLKKRTLNPGDRIFLTWRPEDSLLLPPCAGDPP